MRAATLRRLEKVEATVSVERRRRERAAIDALRATMTTEHRDLLAAWSRSPEVAEDYRAHPRDTCVARLVRLRPPALARAAVMLLAWHLDEGRPLTLPDYVAEVYLRDPDALPGLACEGCGYCMPIRGRLLPNGQLAYGEEGYVGPCPACAGYRTGMAGAPA